MKALIISNLTKRFQPGHFTMIEPLQELGYEVHWAANFSEYKEDINKVPIKIHHIDFIRNPFHPINFKAYIQLMKLLKQEKYELIHCNSPIGGVLGRICGRQTKVPKIIYTAHGFHFYKGAPLVNRTLYKWVEMYLSRKTDVLITMNQEDKELAEKLKLRKNGRRYFIHGVGIDTSIFRNIEVDISEKRKELGLKEDDFILISMGDLIKRKNYEVVINALGKINNKKIHYIICGTGPLESKLRSLVEQNGIKEQVHFIGFRTDVAELLKISDLFILSSYQEGLPRSTMEAMSAGLPVICSKIRGNVDLIDDGYNGYLIDTDNVGQIADKINNMVENKLVRDEMIQRNKELINTYDVENIKKEMLEIYYKEGIFQKREIL